MIAQQQPYVVWTRMHAEAGQKLQIILERKERERVAGNGIFFWGVGNPPSTAIRPLARAGKPVAVVFSKMKSKPKALDQNPGSTVVWRRYIDHEDQVQILPPHVLITSRGASVTRTKTLHYALQCFSSSPLGESGQLRHFDPQFYRNAGGTGASVGSSQVTALLVPRDDISPPTVGPYSIDICAELTGSYWVRLLDPLVLSEDARDLVDKAGRDQVDWLSLVADVRQSERLVDTPVQPRLL